MGVCTNYSAHSAITEMTYAHFLRRRLTMDAGMCGDYDSVIGMEKSEPLRRFVTGMAKGRFSPASGSATLCGVLVETDDASGKAVSIDPFKIGGKIAA